MPLTRVCNCETDNLPTSVHSPRIEGKQGRTRSREGIKISHYTVLPDENRAVWPAIGRAGLPRHLPLVVDAVAVRLGCIGKRFQDSHHAFLPQNGMLRSVFISPCAGGLPSLVDVHRLKPCDSGYVAVLP